MLKTVAPQTKSFHSLTHQICLFQNSGNMTRKLSRRQLSWRSSVQPFIPPESDYSRTEQAFQRRISHESCQWQVAPSIRHSCQPKGRNQRREAFRAPLHTNCHVQIGKCGCGNAASGSRGPDSLARFRAIIGSCAISQAPESLKDLFQGIRR